MVSLASHMRSHGGLAATWLIIARVRPCSMRTYTRMRTHSMRSGVLVMTSQREVLLQLQAGKPEVSALAVP